ncbi:phospholipid-transporting ATPase ABCA3-like isoform X1 [Asterias amurensis]|uniref:phospholipid-transporting ATPase ABCA3-like isoform X1 n=1 Tax=Asterias amurensis TaxID=7602 RepID=UPI003AB8136F
MGMKGRQFRLLLWKNFVLQIRRPIGTIIELLLPFFATSLLLMARLLIQSEDLCFTTFEPGLSSQESLSTAEIQQLQSCFVNGTDCPELAYFPQNNLTDLLMAGVALQVQVPLSPSNFTSEEELVKTAAEDLNLYYAAIIFDLPMDATTLPPNVTYKIRLAHDLVSRETWYTERTYPNFQLVGPRTYNMYKIRFLRLQNAIDSIIAFTHLVDLQGAVTAFLLAQTVQVQLQQFPHPGYLSDSFLLSLEFLMPFLICLSFIYSAGTVVRELVLEKEKRLKESMKMMGLANWLHWLAWYIKNLVFLIIPVLLITIMLKVGKVFPNSDPTVLFVFLLLWMVCSIAWGFTISVFFSRALLGLIFGFVAWFLNYLPLLFLDYDSSTLEVKTAASLLSNVAFGFGVKVMALYEGQGVGLQWSNLATSPSLDDPFSMGIVFMMFILDTFIYLLITWYVEAIFPGSYGIPKPPYFPFQRSYWCGQSARGAGDIGTEIEMGLTENVDSANHEADPAGVPAGIRIKDLTKVYKSSVGNKLAVDGLSLSMYQGQITALLGHNGAGKTTTMSILTGLFSPSSGTAYVNGCSIVNNIDGVRKSLGLCPQHNVLFDRLTVKEHLEFFISLKGKSGPEAKQEVNTMIADLQLVNKADSQSTRLSGGMKRKLSCAIALIGGSEVVILDEPTSGMDPYARRATWDLLLKYRQGRTMVLTTHFMDEADLLGDRIAIMANGQLLCSGSSLFLKNRFGVGYHLTLVRNKDCDVDVVHSFIKKHVAQSELESNVGNELDFILPREDSASFKQLFADLEYSRGPLGIDSFGVSITTMEEVFMKAGEMAEDELNGNAPTLGNGEAAADASSREQLTPNAEIQTNGKVSSQAWLETGDVHTGISLKMHQFVAIFIKRFLYSKRDKKSIVTQFILPIVFVIFGLLIIKTSDGLVSDPARILNLMNISRYDPSISPKVFYADLRNMTNNEDLVEIPADAFDPFLNVSADDLLSFLNISSDAIGNNTLNVTDFGNNSFLFNVTDVIGDQDLLQFVPVVLDEVPIASINVSAAVGTLVSDNTGNMINGVAKTSDHDCCDYSNIILNNECANLLYNSSMGSELCADVESFGYYSCQRCLTSTSFEEKISYNVTKPLTGTTEESIDCPIGANTMVLADVNTFFQDYVLNQSEGDNLFFNKYVAGFTLADTSAGGILLTGWYSNEAYHTSSEVLNAMSNIVLKYFTNETYSITTINHPLPNSAVNQVENAAESTDTFSLSLLILYGMSFLSASFIHFIVTEKQSKAKHLQMVGGLDGFTYWVANLCWDSINYFLVYIVILIVFAAFNVAAFSGENLGTVAIILLLFGWAAVPFVYLLSYLFKTPVTAYAVTVTLLSILGLGTIITVFVLEIIGTYEDEVLIVDHVFMALPTHCLARGLIQLATNVAIRSTCTASDLDMEFCKAINVTYFDNNLDWDQPGVGQHCFYLAMEGIIYFALTLLVEMQFFIPSRSAKYLKHHSSAPEDIDVAAERKKVEDLNHREGDYAVILKNLSKTYRSKPSPAVDQLNLAIPKGECFGLLGVNGAGKTTSFGMLTGDLSITAGKTYMEGYSIQADRRKAQQKMGYCPQFDALIDQLTGRELLMLFARLRGIPRHNIQAVVKSTITHLNLDKWADKLCGTYSGGNKRKLNTATALVGSPPIVLLDEPTSGMDPKARRHLWNALTQVMKDGRSIVLTSHSMEECEALCTRLAIMVNGQFKCLGSTQHLKSRFGTGYTMMIKVDPTFNLQVVKNFVQSVFAGSILLEEHQSLLHYQVDNEQLSWSYIFGTLEESREGLGIEDYSVSQTTLEQVFINFAKEQHSEESGKGRQQRPPAPYNSPATGPMPAVIT